MKEQLISFKTEKLAKSKGFSNQQTFYKSIIRNYVDSGGNETSDTYSEVKLVTEYVTPTQSLLQKWLRGKGIEITIIKVEDGYIGIVYNDIQELAAKMFEYCNSKRDTFNTYENALEYSLQTALNLTK